MNAMRWLWITGISLICCTLLLQQQHILSTAILKVTLFEGWHQNLRKKKLVGSVSCKKKTDLKMVL